MPDELRNDDQQSELNSNQQLDMTTMSEKPISDAIEHKHVNPYINVTKNSNKRAITVIIILLVLAIVAGSIWFFVFNIKNKSITNSPKSQNIVADIDPQLEKLTNPTTGETWLDKPIIMPKQGFFLSSDFGPENETEYTQVGKRGDNTIILSATSRIGIYYTLFEKSPAGQVTYIARPNALAVYNEDNDNSFEQSFNSNILVSKDIHYDSFNIPSKIIFDDNGSYVTSNSNDLGGYPNTSKTIKDKIVKQFGKSAFIERQSTNVDTNLTSVYYLIKTPLNTEITMTYEPLDTDLTKYQWQTGLSYSIGKLHSITRGCGAGTGSAVTIDNNITDDMVQKSGRSGNGLTVYEIKDSSNALIQKAYNEFHDSYQDNTDSISVHKKSITLKEFVDNHGVVLFKDINGKWLVYVAEEYAPLVGGCAKPVVYLYPTKEQTVTVKVGADVKISDPYYNPTAGWTAIAKPNGQLTVNGNRYNSLFWEGPGIGQYPTITEGTVVKQKDVINTIREQLVQQGLNSNEISDFMDYWHDKLPKNSYVRLTWFDTVQMDQLAPLYILPKPGTVIRVFLDASGFDEPIKIPAQNLKSIPRSGFTVVEWGGLPSHKLY